MSLELRIRAALVIGFTREARLTIFDRVRELYAARSELVHGGEATRIASGDLHDLRQIVFRVSAREKRPASARQNGPTPRGRPRCFAECRRPRRRRWRMRKRPCSYCRCWFTPDPRVGKRQRACTKPSCQEVRRVETQARWRASHPEYAVPDVRFRRQGVHIWTLELPSHTGRWDKTPFRGPMEAMLDVLQHEIPWVLAPVDEDPQATSGTRY